jgi:hypothetical protein
MKSSKLVAVSVALLLFGSLFAGSAVAVESDPQNLPGESEVGTNVEATFEITDLFGEFREWTLSAETELENATWTIDQYDQAGDQVGDTTEIDGQTATEGVSLDDDTATVEVRVTGTTPEIEEFSYEPPQRFVVASFTQEREGGANRDIATHETHHYTQESRDARQTIDGARTAVEGSGSDEAQSSLDSAISAYESGNFENAIDLAERAEGEASQSQLIRNVLLVGGVVVAVLLVAAVGYRVYKSRQQGPGRLK